jgi:hypothetical protein
MGYTTESKCHDIKIDDPALTEHGFTRFSLPLNGGNATTTTSVMVVHNTDKSKMMYPNFYKSDLDKTVQSRREEILSDGILIDNDTADNLVRYFRNECVLLSEDEDSEFFKNGKGNGKSSSSSEQQQQEQQQKPKPKRPYSTYKYSNKGKGDLHEAVILAGGLPIFLKCEDNQVKSVQRIEEASRVLRPPNTEEYPYEPYEFSNIEEVKSYFDRARTESIDSLFCKAKTIVKKYNDQGEHKLILLAADIVWSYFQDRFSTTHYVSIVGGNVHLIQ